MATVRTSSGTVSTDGCTNESVNDNSKKRTILRGTRIRKCVCFPVDRGVVEFPTVWSELRRNNQLCDGTITCNDKVIFHLHRVILSAISPYFRVLFTSTLNDQMSEQTNIAVETSSDLFAMILDYAYTGHCDINEENVQNLLPVADRYEVLGVLQLCCHFLLNQMKPDNCLGILRFASHYFCRDLEQRCRRYILQKFKDVIDNDSNEIVDLNSIELYSILKDDTLNVRNEEIVFKTIKKWVEHDSNGRKCELFKLLCCVRFGLISFEYFSNSVISWKLIHENKQCSMLMQRILSYLTELNSRPETVRDLTLWRPRVPYEVLFAIGGWTAGSPINFVETYDTRADRWLVSRDTDATLRAYHGLVALDGLIYMIGGFDVSEHFNTVRCFDPVRHVWTERACMYHARCYVSVATLENKIYAMGGYNGRSRMSSVERYDPNINQWELVASMQKQRSDASAATLNKKIYIVGGFNGHEVLNSAEMYDPALNQWSFIHTMNCARSGVSLVTYKESLFAFGGFNGFTRLSTGEKYTPGVSDEWIQVTEMFNPRSNFATVVLDDLIFVIGGFNGTTTISYVECYDAETNEWYDATPMNLNRSALGACVIAGLPNSREYSFISKNGGWEEREVHFNQGDR